MEPWQAVQKYKKWPRIVIRFRSYDREDCSISFTLHDFEVDYDFQLVRGEIQGLEDVMSMCSSNCTNLIIWVVNSQSYIKSQPKRSVSDRTGFSSRPVSSTPWSIQMKYRISIQKLDENICSDLEKFFTLFWLFVSCSVADSFSTVPLSELQTPLSIVGV